MNKDVKATVAQCSVLEVQVNKGNRHRIMHSGIKAGSLWIIPRIACYYVSPTGEVETRLYDFLVDHFGSETGSDQQR